MTGYIISKGTGDIIGTGTPKIKMRGKTNDWKKTLTMSFTMNEPIKGDLRKLFDDWDRDLEKHEVARWADETAKALLYNRWRNW